MKLITCKNAGVVITIITSCYVSSSRLTIVRNNMAEFILSLLIKCSCRLDDVLLNSTSPQQLLGNISCGVTCRKLTHSVNIHDSRDTDCRCTPENARRRPNRGLGGPSLVAWCGAKESFEIWSTWSLITPWWSIFHVDCLQMNLPNPFIKAKHLVCSPATFTFSHQIQQINEIPKHRIHLTFKCVKY